MSTPRLIAESVSARPFDGCKVDRDAGVIRGVRVCGLSSRNQGRRYPWDKLDPSVYEGRPVNCGHGRDDRGDVPPAARIGWLANVRPDPNGPRADLHILNSHPLAAQVYEAAERNPALYGLSHVAHCRTRWEGGVEVIESIGRVDSVDLVADPATTRGIYESHSRRNAMPGTLRQFIEGLQPRLSPKAKKQSYKLMLEADEMGLMDAPVDAMPEADPEGDADAQLVAGFKAAIDSLWDAYTSDKDAAKFLKAVGKYVKAHAKLASGSDDAGDVEVDTDTEIDAEESAKPKGIDGLVPVFEVLGRVGVKAPTVEQIQAVAATAEPFRESVARAFAPKTNPETPQSVGRHQAASLAPHKTAKAVTKDEIAAFIRG